MLLPQLYDNPTISSYQPTGKEQEVISVVQKEYELGQNILDKPYMELGNLSAVERKQRDALTFNAFVDETVENASEAWKWRGTRSKARNKAIAMHAQLTAGYIIPMYMAQNENDEVDKDISDVMRLCAEWLMNNSEYRTSFLKIIMGMLINPVSYLGAEFQEVSQKIKEKKGKGWTTKEILDEELSGFQAPVYSAEEILISNAFEQNIQRQRFVIKRRYIDYTEAEGLYGKHENWDYVQPGTMSVFGGEGGVFYDIKDQDHPFLVEEVLYQNRREDIEIPFVGGIYIGDSDTDANPIKHRSYNDAPRYNVIPFGYQRINEHFFFYKSLMNSQYWDNMLLDAMTEIVMNRAILDTDMPIAVSGSEKIDSDVIFPKSVVVFEDKDTKVQGLLPQANLSGMFAAMGTIERSMEESSVSGTTAGQLPEREQKATSVSIAERNARIMLGSVGKTIAESIVQYGGLMSDIIINNITVPQIEELSGNKSKLKYRSLILSDRFVGGKNISEVIKFDEKMLGQEMTESETNSANLKLYGETLESGKSIYQINPELFRKMKYLLKVEPETMFPKNEEYQQAISMQLMSVFANNPFVSLEALTRKVAYAFYRGEAEEIMQEQQGQMMGQIPQTVAGQQAVNKATAVGMRGLGV